MRIKTAPSEDEAAEDILKDYRDFGSFMGAVFLEFIKTTFPDFLDN